MIRRIRLIDYKTHVDTTLDLGRLTVIVGPNGAGKTAMLSALHGICQMPRNRFDYHFKHARDPRDLVRRGADGFQIALDGDDWRLVLDVKGRENPWDAKLLSTVGDAEAEVRDAHATHPAQKVFGTLREITAAISSAVFLRLDARSLARPARVSRQPRVEFDGQGLAAVIAELILGGSERLAAIVESLAAIVPQVQGLRVRTVDIETEDGRVEGGVELLVDFKGARGVPAHAVSEGTLIAIGLLTLLHAEHRPSLVLLDDIDQALHPKAQWALVATLRGLLAADPALQIVATTHSPYLVDALEPDEVRVMALDANGVSHCRALTEHPSAGDRAVVLAIAEPEREAWHIVGFEPRDEPERTRLDEVRAQIGGDPRALAHTLDPKRDDAPRGTKRVIGLLAGHDDDRVADSLADLDLSTLAERGGRVGLAAFLRDISERLVPLIGT